MAHTRATQDEDGSLKTEKAWWTYIDLAEHSGIPVSTLQKYVHRKLLRSPELLKFGRSVRFDPVKVMRRLQNIGEKNAS